MINKYLIFIIFFLLFMIFLVYYYNKIQKKEKRNIELFSGTNYLLPIWPPRLESCYELQYEKKKNEEDRIEIEKTSNERAEIDKELEIQLKEQSEASQNNDEILSSDFSYNTNNFDDELILAELGEKSLCGGILKRTPQEDISADIGECLNIKFRPFTLPTPPIPSVPSINLPNIDVKAALPNIGVSLFNIDPTLQIKYECLKGKFGYRADQYKNQGKRYLLVNSTKLKNKYNEKKNNFKKYLVSNKQKANNLMKVQEIKLKKNKERINSSLLKNKNKLAKLYCESPCKNYEETELKKENDKLGKDNYENNDFESDSTVENEETQSITIEINRKNPNKRTNIDINTIKLHPTCTIHKNAVWAMCNQKPFKKWEGDSNDLTKNINNCNDYYTNPKKSGFNKRCPI